MTRDRLSSFGTLSVANEIAEDLDFTVLIHDFIDKKSRTVEF